MSVRNELDESGFAVVPSVLDPDEVARLRGTLTTHFGERGSAFNLGWTQPNAAIECPDISWVFSHPKVLETYRDAYGSNDLLFTGHCDIHQDSFSAWHKDTGSGDCYFDEDCFVEECRVIKMAIYLQDHFDEAGLTVAPGSHRSRQWGSSEDGARSIASRAGDAVLFDVRIDHRGRRPSSTERIMHTTGMSVSKIIRRVTRSTHAPGEPAALSRIAEHLPRTTRQSVFFTIALDDRFGEQFARNNMSRQRRQYADPIGDSYPDGLAERMGEAGVAVFQPDLPNC
ncbi:MAG: hypothetical protein F2520_04665 [Actinobacteria bacterium]|uniref:Unannotated protein n=1 Tax=freshwater metagenome TaxID=449393 RepID=A0A6J5YFL2_9ZZZZ|nr:hypothetical protein [Actinomycetota bacterium]MTA77534.1 hypothetical protein [Actinomycetota bacterium]